MRKVGLSRPYLQHIRVDIWPAWYILTVPFLIIRQYRGHRKRWRCSQPRWSSSLYSLPFMRKFICCLLLLVVWTPSSDRLESASRSHHLSASTHLSYGQYNCGTCNSSSGLFCFNPLSPSGVCQSRNELCWSSRYIPGRHWASSRRYTWSKAPPCCAVGFGTCGLFCFFRDWVSCGHSPFIWMILLPLYFSWAR